MKGKIIGIGIVLLIIFAIGGGIWYFFHEKEQTVKEYIPEEEITEDQLRQSMVTLYYYNAETKEIVSQSKLMDVKELLENPYKKLVMLLMEKPKNEKLETVIPKGTVLNKAELIGNTVILDFSKEFVENHAVENEKNIIKAIVQTLTQLTEVNGVKITIDGKENQLFSENGISFENTFSVDTMV